jgi:small subunit ribosomal protein S3Ae
MAVGKNKRLSKGGKRGSKKKIQEPMSRKEWYDVVAPANFKTRQFAKTVCNKTQGIKLAADNLRGRVYTANLADLNKASSEDLPFRNVKFSVQEVQGRNLLTQFHGMTLTADRERSLLRKWCTLIENVVEAKTADGYVLRIFFICFTRKQDNQLSKNSYSKTHLEKWVRSRMTKITQRRLARSDINQAVTQITQDILTNALFKRCNPILPLRDLKIRKVKVIRTPKFEAQKLLDAHGTIPVSIEDQGREVQVVEAPAAEKKAEKAE